MPFVEDECSGQSKRVLRVSLGNVFRLCAGRSVYTRICRECSWASGSEPTGGVTAWARPDAVYF